MSSSGLTFFSYEILGLVGSEGAGAHDLLRLARSGRLLAWAGESQYYTEPKRLARLGYLAASKQPGRTRERTVYMLTAKGREALAGYAATPAAILPVKSDVLQRLLICDLVGEPATRAALAAVRDDIAELRAQLDEADERAGALPHRARYLRMVNDHLRGILDLHEQLVEEAERELA